MVYYSSCVLLGYLFGCVNPAYILGRHKGYDIRQKGSGNPGATNTMLVMGFKKGLLVAAFDIFKAFLAFHMVKKLFPDLPYAGLSAALACVVGHMFPVFLKFRGGKGLASFGGVILSTDWKLFLFILTLSILTAVITDYGVFATLFAGVAFPLTVGVIGDDWLAASLIFCVSLLMVFRHRENIIRFFRGQERGVSSLWKKENYKLPAER